MTASAEIFAAIKDGDMERVSLLVSASGGGKALDVVDEFGTSLLQSAAFAGRPDMVRLLLDAGADPNYSQDHPHSYTALMFAALSGKADSCRLLLEAGADAQRRCSIGRTAAELAAFTGQHATVAAINHFVPLHSVLDAAKAAHASMADPAVEAAVVAACHDLAASSNLHPVHLLRFLRQRPLLLSHSKAMGKVLEELREAEMRRQETNEVMALKVHVMLRVLREAEAWLAKEGGSGEEVLPKLSKHWLAKEGAQLELLLRQAVKEFPFHQSSLFQGLVASLAKIRVGEGGDVAEGKPSALVLLRSAILGQKAEMDVDYCGACGAGPSSKRCARCKLAHYCSQECQKLHWSATHKKTCTPKT